MSRFDFYQAEKSKRVARAAVDRLLVDLERYFRNRDFGFVTVRVQLKEGEPDSFVVTNEVSVRADNLYADENR